MDVKAFLRPISPAVVREFLIDERLRIRRAPDACRSLGFPFRHDRIGASR